MQELHGSWSKFPQHPLQKMEMCEQQIKSWIHNVLLLEAIAFIAFFKKLI